MVRLRKSPVCRETLEDGRPCASRVEALGDCCVSCLERLATSPDVTARRELAREPRLALHLFPALESDPDRTVRLTIAQRVDCPLPTLRRLEQDEEHDVSEAATASLSGAPVPRTMAEADELFGPANVRRVRPDDGDGGGEAGGGDLGWTDGKSPADPGPGSARGRVRRLSTTDGCRSRSGGGGSGPSPDPVMERLESLDERLASLESAMTATGRRLTAVSARLDRLHGASASALELCSSPPSEQLASLLQGRTRSAVGSDAVHPRQSPPPRATTDEPLALQAGSHGAPAGSRDSLLPVRQVSALGPGSRMPSDLAVAAWIVLVPLLVRRRRHGREHFLGMLAIGGPRRGPAPTSVATPGPPPAVAAPATTAHTPVMGASEQAPPTARSSTGPCAPTEPGAPSGTGREQAAATGGTGRAHGRPLGPSGAGRRLHRRRRFRHR